MSIKILNGIDVDNGVLYTDTANDRVGIGTPSPGDPLTVIGKISSLGGTNNAKNIKIYANDSFGYVVTNASKIYMSTGLQVDSGLIGSYNEDLQLQVSGGTKMYLDSSGNVGIGTTSPSSFYPGSNNLVVGSGTGDKAITVYAGDTSTAYYLFAKGTIGADRYHGQVRYNFNADTMEFITGGSTSSKFTIKSTGVLQVPSLGQGFLQTDSSGNISISGGGTLPGGPYLPLAGGTMTGNLVMDGKAGVGNSIGLATGTNSNLPSLKFYTYNNTDPGGGLGTGTGNIIQSDLGTGGLIIRQNVNDADIIFQSDDGAGGIATYLTLDGSSTDAYFSNPGNVGIGTTSPLGQLDVRQAQQSSPFTTPFLKLYPSTTTNLTGHTTITLGTSPVDNYGVSLSGWRYGADGDPKFRIKMHNNSASGIDALTIDSSGDVGIGTTSPGSILHIVDSAPTLKLQSDTSLAPSTISFDNSSGTQRASLIFSEANDTFRLTNTAGNSRLNLDNYTGTFSVGTSDQSGVILGATTVTLKSNYSTALTCDYAGRVGIGTTNPGYKLDVAGNLRVDNGNVGSTSGDELTHARIQGARHFIDFKEVRTANDTDWRNTTFKIQTGVDSTNHQSIDFVADGSYQEHIDIRTGNQLFNTRFTSDGKVGIGTTSPSDKLTVEDGNIRLNSTSSSVSQGLYAYLNNSSPNMGGISWHQNPGFIGSEWTHYKQSSPYTQARIRLIGDASGQMNVNLNNSQVFTILASNGGVGIANTSPTGLLVVGAGTSNTNDRSNTLLSEESTGSTANSLGLVNSSLGAYGNETALNFHLSRTYSPTARIIAYQDGSSSMTDTGLKFFTYNGSLQQRMTIDHDGYVGIGVTSPGAKLDIFNAGGSAGTLAACQTYSALTIKPYSSVDSKLTFSANGVSTQLIQATNNAGTNGRQISLQPFSGDVGIGVILPSEKLDVNGHIKAFNGYKGYVSYFHNAGFFHSPRSQDGANPLWIPINTTGMSSSDQYYNTWVPLYAGRVRKIIIKHVSGSTPVATVCTFRKKINGVLSSSTYAGTVTGGGAAGMKVTFDFGTNNFTFNAEDEVQIGFVTGVATQPRMGGCSCQIWYEYNIT